MKNLRTFVLFAVFLILGCHALSVTASAIPMWEFLSRDEKVSLCFSNLLYVNTACDNTVDLD